MSSRSYMSIGDVLTLLRQEFPDVTISKIRFLESQGLVNPERTPSGYRKFYEHDVERLRWVLRQQREHFLPLKVIKDRLDDGSAMSEPEKVPTKMVRRAAAGTSAGDAEGGAAAARDEHRSSEPVLVGHWAASESATAGTEQRGTDEHPDSEPVIGATLPGIDGARAEVTEAAGGVGAEAVSAGARLSSRSGPGTPAAPRVSANGPGAAGSATAAGADARTVPGAAGGPVEQAGPPRTADVQTASGVPAMASSSERAHGVSDPDVPVSARVPSQSSPAGDTPAGDTPAGGTASGGTASGGPASTGTGNGTGQRGPVGSPKPSTSSTSVDLNGASLSLDELASACGLATAVLQELQSYGLLAPTLVAGVEYFDEESLAVANVAARFAQFGIEPRHLRLYKNAADREAGFVEQIVLPLVRQRNPEARVRALETVDELTQLGQQLRGSLLRSDLRSLLNG